MDQVSKGLGFVLFTKVVLSTKMEEDKAEQLAGYREQLEVLDAALRDPSTDADDRAALTDTRSDLIEVINLLQEVVGLDAAAPTTDKNNITAAETGSSLLKADTSKKEKETKKRGHELIGRTCEVQIGGSWYTYRLIKLYEFFLNRI